MALGQELRGSLTDILSNGTVEIRERGTRISPAGSLSWEVRGAEEKPLLHLWAENCNVTRRVLAIANQSGDCLSLAVERFGKTKPDRLVIVRTDYARSPRELSRAEFCEQLRRILAQQFPDETLEKISITSDLEHSLSGVYARGITCRNSASYPFLAVPDSQLPGAIESSLTYALLWLERTRQSSSKHPISALRLIVPKGKSAVLAHRLGALDPRLAIRIFELDPLSESLVRVEPCGEGNVSTWLAPHREAQLLIEKAHDSLEPIIALAPEAIRVHASLQTQEVHLRFRGLAFVRWHDGQLQFGVGATWKELTPRTQPSLKNLVAALQNYRSPVASDLRHPLFRAQAERWMQFLILEDVRNIDISLDPDYLYEQVFACGGGPHGVIDLLGVTRSRRVALIELKASENLNLPLQAADYYSRIRRHLTACDLTRYGYFPGLQLQSAPPLVYLVAPALRFHPSTDSLLRYLNPEIEVIRIGLAESWRRSVHVVMRQ